MVAELVNDNRQYGIGIVGGISILIDIATADDRAQCGAAILQLGTAPVIVRTYQQAEHDTESASALWTEIIVEPVVVHLLIYGIERLFKLLVQVFLLRVPIVEMGGAVKIVQRFQEYIFLLIWPTVESSLSSKKLSLKTMAPLSVKVRCRP